MSLNYTAASTKGWWGFLNFPFEGLELSQDHAALRCEQVVLQGTGTRDARSPRVQVRVLIEMPRHTHTPKQGPPVRAILDARVLVRGD